MRWEGRRESGNVEDRRGEGYIPSRFGGGFSFADLPGGPRTKISIAVVLIVIMLAMGMDFRQIIAIGLGAPVTLQRQASAPPSAADEQAKRFVSVVLADTEDVWNTIFSAEGKTYQLPTLVLFRGGVRSGCGAASSAIGPFYCPADERIYIDLSFFDELSKRLGAPGDFAAAYVLAHEVGHHVQHQLGIERQLTQTRFGKTPNAQQVKMELQADCFAGIFAHHAQRLHQSLEAGDIDEALGAASAIGDDRLQKRSQGFVVPDSFTHGSSAQRSRWFKTGYTQGTLGACDTFGAPSL